MAEFIIRTDESYRIAKATLKNILNGTIEGKFEDRLKLRGAIQNYEIVTKQLKISPGMKGYNEYESLFNRASRMRNRALSARRNDFSKDNFLTIETYNYLTHVLHTYHNTAPHNVRNLIENLGAPMREIEISPSWREEMVKLKLPKQIQKKKRVESGKKTFQPDNSQRNEQGIKDALTRAQEAMKRKPK